MATRRHLKNAPIREALIDIQFEPQLTIDSLNSFAEAVKSKFDKQTKIWQQSFGLEFVPDGDSKASSEQAVIGIRFDSEKLGHVVQARVNGFTFSKLAPYKDWEEVKLAAQQAWQDFVEFSKPETVNRLAVRYINSIEIPLPINDFSEYFTAPPQIPAKLPQGLTAFLQRVVMVDPKTQSVAVVTQALEEPQSATQSNRVTIFLDIDSFQVKQLDPSSEELWTTFDVLRDFKNNIFFEHITERAAELFE